MQRFPNLPFKEFKVFKKLDSPSKIQDFIDGLRINFETDGETCRSPLFVLRRKEAHCMEGAMLAAAILWYRGERPLLLDLQTAKADRDHVITLFRSGGRWGAISKTNHAVLRYRDPVYKSVRELVMSYFNEYFLDNGKKTLLAYSAPFDLAFYGDGWLTADKNLWEIGDDLNNFRHFKILRKSDRLRPADPVEITAGKITQWKKGRLAKSLS